MVLHDCKEIFIVVRYCNDKRGEKMIMFKYDYDKNAALYIRDSLNGIVCYQDHNGNLHIKLMLESHLKQFMKMQSELVISYE